MLDHPDRNAILIRTPINSINYSGSTAHIMIIMWSGAEGAFGRWLRKVDLFDWIYEEKDTHAMHQN